MLTDAADARVGTQSRPEPSIGNVNPPSHAGVLQSQATPSLVTKDDPGRVLVKNVSDTSVLASNADFNSKHQTADELKEEEDANKAGEDLGPMSPFFQYVN